MSLSLDSRCYCNHRSNAAARVSGDEIANISGLVYRPPSISHRWADRSQSITPYMKPFVSGCTKGSTYHVSLRVLSASSESGSPGRRF
ncbi:hypothetical protein KOW79_001089 [Hemibagrus wyckioides]|uniref:Uncharacterized protein n=1 Tax=Hemibagrus wyckioides TaxID=337641 RepID=A0A9D3ST45_9TELE|nr:hypothetical protein KOW79_001089 [Hemibagrus wyckioides]